MAHPDPSWPGATFRLIDVRDCTILHVYRAVDVIDPMCRREQCSTWLTCEVLARTKYVDEDAVEDAALGLPPIRIDWHSHELLKLACTDVGSAYDHTGRVTMWCNHEPVNAAFMQSRLPIEPETGLAIVQDCLSLADAMFRQQIADKMEAVYQVWEQDPDDIEKRLGWCPT
jgi:hypothetical protein